MPALISYRNLADSATVTSPAATPLAGFPLANLRTRQLSQVTRWNVASPNLAQVELVIDLGPGFASLQRPRMIGLLGANFAPISPGGDIDLRATLYYSNSSGGPWVQLYFGQVNDKALATFPGNLILGSTDYAPSRFRYWRVLAFWTTVDSYAQLGRLWLGDALSVAIGADGDWELGFQDTGQIATSAGAQVYESRRQRTRILRCNFTGVDQMAAFGFTGSSGIPEDVPSFNALQAEAGLTSEIIVAPKSESPLWTRRTGIYGHIDPNSVSIRKVPGAYYSTSLTAVEER